MRSTRAWRRSGSRSSRDFNVPDPNGYGYRQGTIWKGLARLDRERVSRARAPTRPISKCYRSRACGACCSTASARSASRRKRRTGSSGSRARKEVIVCGGTFHSPHLLLHSGIGDERDLKSWGITPLHHLPAVGRHLRDHPAAPIAMETDDSTSYGHSWKALPRNVAQGVRYLATRRGQYASNLFETNAYIRTLPESDRPDLQIVFQPARRNPKPFPIPLGHGYAIVSVCIYPRSTGRVTPVGPGPARRAAHRPRARQRRDRFADAYCAA